MIKTLAGIAAFFVLITLGLGAQSATISAANSPSPRATRACDEACLNNKLDMQTKVYEGFAASVYIPYCAKHKGLASVQFAKAGQAYPADVICQDKYEHYLGAPDAW
jgi:hypothetical protein